MGDDIVIDSMVCRRFPSGWRKFWEKDPISEVTGDECDADMAGLLDEIERLRAALDDVGHGLADECLDDLTDPLVMGYLAGLRYRALAASTGEEDDG